MWIIQKQAGIIDLLQTLFPFLKPMPTQQTLWVSKNSVVLRLTQEKKTRQSIASEKQTAE